jgi:hypothetical protein
MAATPVFAGTPKMGLGQVSTANTNRDGTGTLATLFTAGASGSYLKKIVCKATVTTTAGMVRIFVSLDGGTTKRLIHEFTVDAVTPSASVAGWTEEQEFNEVLPASAIVYASTHNAEAINLRAEYGDF